MSNGLQIVLEGPDGVGKSIQARKLAEYLSHPNLAIPNRLTCHPGETQIGSGIRKLLLHDKNKCDPYTEALLFAADNSSYINEILIPSLERGIMIIADRNNFISSLAYQTASGLNMEVLRRVHAATAPSPRINLLFVLLADEGTIASRLLASRSNKDNFESRGRDYAKKILRAYNDIASNKAYISAENFMDSPTNIVPIDANRPIGAVFSELANKIVQKIREHQNKRKVAQ